MKENYNITGAQLQDVIPQQSLNRCAAATVNPLTEHFKRPITLQSDPKGLDPKTPGAKLDYGKSPVYRGLLDYFPRACMAIADVSAKGAAKYSWKGWEKVENGVQRYADAGARHVVYEAIEGPIDAETGCWHKAQKAWNALAELELFLREQEGK